MRWARDDEAWFKANPERSLRVRPPGATELAVLALRHRDDPGMREYLDRLQGFVSAGMEPAMAVRRCADGSLRRRALIAPHGALAQAMAMSDAALRDNLVISGHADFVEAAA
jgi:hypothetical protein